MDLIKKRKADENGGAYFVPSDIENNSFVAQPSLGLSLSPEDADKILEPLTKELILPILRAALLNHSDVLEAVRAVADADPVQRKLFVRGLGWETVTEKLRQVFSVYGELDESNTIVITDKNTGKSKGYGFVTFKHIDAAVLALKDPNKKIDGRITVTQLASAGSSGNSHSIDVAMRKVYVGNIPFDISSERLLAHFSMYGEIEEGPLGFDKQAGKDKGFAFFVYKTEEAAKASLVDAFKTIDGHQLVCKLASDNKKQRFVPGIPNSGPPVMPGGSMPASNYGMGGYMGYGTGPNMAQPPQNSVVHQNMGFNPAVSAQGGPGGQAYGAGYGAGSAPYSGSVGGTAPGDFGGGYGSNGGYRMPSGNVGVQNPGNYPNEGNYGFQPTYPSQQNQLGAGPRPPVYHGTPYY